MLSEKSLWQVCMILMFLKLIAQEPVIFYFVHNFKIAISSVGYVSGLAQLAVL